MRFLSTFLLLLAPLSATAQSMLYGGSVGGPGMSFIGSSGIVFDAPLSSWGAVLPEDANTVAHVTWNGTALVDSKGNSWTQNGTVPQVAASASPFTPGRAGAGPYSAANYYSATSSPLGFAGDFTQTVEFHPLNLAAVQTLVAVTGGTLDGYRLDLNTAGQVVLSVGNGVGFTTVTTASTVAVAQGANVATFGRVGTTWYAKLNGGTSASGVVAGYAAVTSVRVGLSSVGSQAFSGPLYELHATSTAWNEASVAALQQNFFGHVANTGQTLTVARNSTATYEANGIIWTAPANALRIDGDGALIEPSRTNVLVNSAALTAAGWVVGAGGTGTNPVVTVDQAVAPDGTTTAEQIAFSAVSGASFSVVYQATASLAAGDWMPSVHLKTASGTATIYIMQTPDGATYTSTACSVTTAWSLCTGVKYTLGAPGTLYWQIGVDLRDATQTAKAAQTVFAWGAQREAGSYATSYIAAAATSTTRAADDVSIPKPSGITFAASDYSIAFTAKTIANLAGTGLWSVGFGSNASYMPMVRLNAQAADGLSSFFSDNGSSDAELTVADKTASHRYAAYRQGSTITLLADAASASATPGTQPAEPTILYIGSKSAAAHLGGHIKNVCLSRRARSCR